MGHSKIHHDSTSVALLRFIYQKRGPVIIITLTALIVSVIVSFMITPRYRSAVIIYPASFTGTSRSLSGSPLAGPGIMDFGREADTERMLQILGSGAVRRKIIEKYDLMEHYGIGEKSRYPYTALDRKYNNNMRFRKNEYMAIEIEVLDTDPHIAAAIANDIAYYADSMMGSILRDRASATLAIVETEYNRHINDIRELEDSLAVIRRLGIMNYESQSEIMNNAYATAILSGDTASADFFRNRLGILSSYGGNYVSLRDNLELKQEKLIDLKKIFDEARIDAQEIISYNYVIDEATVAEKKSYPVRSLIVAASTLSAFLFALFMLLLIDAFRRQVLRTAGE